MAKWLYILYTFLGLRVISLFSEGIKHLHSNSYQKSSYTITYTSKKYIVSMFVEQNNDFGYFNKL
jgi:hypothetical protein